MKKTYALLCLLLASFTAYPQCAFVDIVVSSSDTAYVQLYHPGFFNMPSGFANMDAWEVTTFDGDIVHQETAGGSFEESFILFDHSVPITDSMVVTLVITNDISGIICTIIDTDSLEIEVDVNEAYIQRVTPGQRVSAVLDAYPSWRIPADVIAIVPTADRQKATVRVRIGFMERDERILRDMGVKVAFLGTESEDEPSQEIQGALVSGESIRADEDGDFVWLVRNGAVEKRRITLGGLRDRPQVLVSQGLAIGDTVVRSSESPLGPGQTVETKD